MAEDDLDRGLAEARRHLQQRIGYRFSDKSLLEEALIHPSVAIKGRENVNNQRLEFLGDRVINLIIADAIFDHVDDRREGVLSRLYADCVDNRTMAEIARSVSLGAALTVQPNTNLADTDKVLADALEALLGAIWRDGGIDGAMAVVMRLWGERILHDASASKDCKTRLQELALARFGVLPSYRIVGRSGPDHAPEFTVEVNFGDYRASAEGSSRRLAEQHAAARLLAVFDDEAEEGKESGSGTVSGTAR